MTPEQSLRASATEMAAAIRSHRVRSRDVVEAHLEVVARRNPALMVSTRDPQH
jgi:Asp-tRNA(Asn)/Glu-tRNA(Gln) amidotransferase A subunit family amidase